MNQLDREIGYVTHGIPSADTLLIRSEDVQLIHSDSSRTTSDGFAIELRDDISPLGRRDGERVLNE